jgi:hypothetical protein
MLFGYIFLIQSEMLYVLQGFILLYHLLYFMVLVDIPCPL